jgi:hypothetical protein
MLCGGFSSIQNLPYCRIGQLGSSRIVQGLKNRNTRSLAPEIRPCVSLPCTQWRRREERAVRRQLNDQDEGPVEGTWPLLMSLENRA